MQSKVISEHLSGIKVIQPELFEDDRGFFMEVFRKDQFEKLKLPSKFVQFNHSRSTKGVIRGLHFQWQPLMGKLMRVTLGSAFLVAVDIRKGSPYFGKWYGLDVSEENRLLIWAPAGFARGFCVTSDFAEIQYLCTGIYNGNNESGIFWNDPAIGIDWPVDNPIISKKDSESQSISQWLENELSNNFIYNN